MAASALKARALTLSLRYNFVTELTSLIVVQEDSATNESFALGAGNFGGGDGNSFSSHSPPTLSLDGTIAALVLLSQPILLNHLF